jgi:hypothetical protein
MNRPRVNKPKIYKKSSVTLQTSEHIRDFYTDFNVIPPLEDACSKFLIKYSAYISRIIAYRDEKPIILVRPDPNPCSWVPLNKTQEFLEDCDKLLKYTDRIEFGVKPVILERISIETVKKFVLDIEKDENPDGWREVEAEILKEGPIDRETELRLCWYNFDIDKENSTITEEPESVDAWIRPSEMDLKKVLHPDLK